jgi:hypothetical protein
MVRDMPVGGSLCALPGVPGLRARGGAARTNGAAYPGPPSSTRSRQPRIRHKLVQTKGPGRK